MLKKGKYILGQVFAIPLPSCYAVGVIARESDEILLGFFLNITFKDLSALPDIELLNPESILIKRFGSLGLDKGVWPLLGAMPGFDTTKWKVPIFKRKDLVSDQYYKVFYNDSLEEIKIELMEESEHLNAYPDDGLAGYGFIEKRLSKLLNC